MAKTTILSPAVEQGVPVAADNLYSYRTGVIGGLLAGAVMTAAMALWGLWSVGSIWYPVNLIAATALRDLQAVPPESLMQFLPLAAVVGTAIHIASSVLLGLLFALILPTLPGNTWAWGLIIGLLLWAGAQYAVLPLINARMAGVVNQPTFVLANVAYSLVLGWYVSRADKIKPGTSLW